MPSLRIEGGGDQDLRPAQPARFSASLTCAALKAIAFRRREVGIGARFRMVFKDVGPDFAIPFWTLDEVASGPIWRYQV